MVAVALPRAASALWTTWLVAIAAGLVLGPRVDPAWGLDLAAPLCLTAMLARRLHDRIGNMAGHWSSRGAARARRSERCRCLVATVAGTVAAASLNQSRP